MHKNASEWHKTQWFISFVTSMSGETLSFWQQLPVYLSLRVHMNLTIAVGGFIPGLVLSYCGGYHF